MARTNAKGNLRGMNRESRDALARGRDVVRRGGASRNEVGDFAPGRRGGLRGRAAEAVAKRLKKHLAALDDDSTVLSQVVAATMLADMEDANRFLRNAWDAVHDFLEADGGGNLEGEDEAAKRARQIAANDGGARAAKATLLLPLIDELRKWSKLTAEMALRVAEIHARTRGGGTPEDYLNRKYGGGEDEAPEREGRATVVVDGDDGHEV